MVIEMAHELDVVVVLATQLKNSDGTMVTDQDLQRAGAIGVNYFVREDVAGLDATSVQSLILEALVRADGRHVRPARYASELIRFVRIPVGAAIVTRVARGTRYQVGRVTSPYKYTDAMFDGHPHVHDVDWIGELPVGSKPGGNPTTTVRSVTDPEVLAAVRQMLRSRLPNPHRSSPVASGANDLI